MFPELLIIVGVGRSGTTYLTWTLREALKIGFPSEPKFVIPFYRKLHKYGNLQISNNLRRLVEDVHRMSAFEHLHGKLDVKSFPEEILERVEEPTYRGTVYAAFQLLAEKWGYSGDHIVGYKDPGDVVHLPELAQLFPTSRFIHIIRDGRDVALSLIEQEWGPTNLYSGMRYWTESVEKAMQDASDISFEERFFEFRFEDLVLNTDEVGKSIVEFINKGYAPEETMRFIELINDTKRLDRIQRWKRRMQTRERYLCEAVGGETLKACGYVTEFKNPKRLNLIQKGYYCGADILNRTTNRLRRIILGAVNDK